MVLAKKASSKNEMEVVNSISFLIMVLLAEFVGVADDHDLFVGRLYIDGHGGILSGDDATGDFLEAGDGIIDIFIYLDAEGGEAFYDGFASLGAVF